LLTAVKLLLAPLLVALARRAGRPRLRAAAATCGATTRGVAARAARAPT